LTVRLQNAIQFTQYRDIRDEITLHISLYLTYTLLNTCMQAEKQDSGNKVTGMVSTLREIQKDVANDGSYEFTPDNVSGIVRDMVLGGEYVIVCMYT
jgi:hypothetical protein